MFYVRQNATHKVVIGPVVAVGDGFTPITNLALGGAEDEAYAILHDESVVDITGYTLGAIANADGYYHLTLQTGISDTVGHTTIIINDDSLCLPVRADFTVIEEAVYDITFAASATGPNIVVPDAAGTRVEADLTYIHGTALTETATQLAGAFVKFFDVASPTGTANSLPDAIPGANNGLVQGDGSVTFTAGVGNRPAVDIEGVGGSTARATDLAEIAQYLFQEAAVLTTIIANDSVIAQMLAADGDISEYNDQNHSLEALRVQGDAAWTTATSVTVSDKTGFSLVSTGLDLVTAWTVAITGNITGNLSGSVASVTTKTGYSLASDGMDGVTLPAGIITAASIANAAIDAATFAADVDAEILSYLVDDATKIDASALNTHAAITPATAAALATHDGKLDAAQTDLDTITDTGVTAVALTTAAIADVWSTDDLTEAYAADGDPATPAELLHMIYSALAQFVVVGTDISCKKLNGSTESMEFTTDDADEPTQRLRTG